MKLVKGIPWEETLCIRVQKRINDRKKTNPTESKLERQEWFKRWLDSVKVDKELLAKKKENDKSGIKTEFHFTSGEKPQDLILRSYDVKIFSHIMLREGLLSERDKKSMLRDYTTNMSIEKARRHNLEVRKNPKNQIEMEL